MTVLLAMPAEVAAQRSATPRETPGRSEVQSAMRSVVTAVRKCAPSMTGTANVFVTFGADGRVRTAVFGLDSQREEMHTDMSFLGDDSVPPINARPGFASTSEGRCILAEARLARVPAFTRPQFVVQYPFLL